MSEYTTGDVDIKATISSEKTVTIEEVITEANQMWKRSKARKLLLGDDDGADALMGELRKTNPQFCKSYPIVLRYMVQMQEYDPKALKTYLVKIKEHPWVNEKEYLDSQADYVAILYKATHPKWNKTDVNKVWTGVRNMLQYEIDLFKQYVEESDKEVTAQEKILNVASMRDLKEFITIAAGTIASRAGTFRMETDLQSDQINVDAIMGGVSGGDTGMMSSAELLE